MYFPERLRLPNSRQRIKMTLTVRVLKCKLLAYVLKNTNKFDRQIGHFGIFQIIQK